MSWEGKNRNAIIIHGPHYGQAIGIVISEKCIAFLI